MSQKSPIRIKRDPIRGRKKTRLTSGRVRRSWCRKKILPYQLNGKCRYDAHVRESDYLVRLNGEEKEERRSIPPNWSSLEGEGKSHEKEKTAIPRSSLFT